MKAPILALRISRRAIGAAVIDGEGLAFADGRHLRSSRAANGPSASRYVRTLLDQVRPSTVVVDCVCKEGGVTEAALDAARKAADAAGARVEEISVGSVLEAFGHPPLPSRRALRQVAEPLFGTDLGEVRGAAKPYVLDAAAAALLAEALDGLGRPAP